MNKKIIIKNERYTLEEIKINYEKGEFSIPKYQRGYVWDNEKRAKLIDSLFRGYPIGSIIIWVNNGKKYILDGQQRTRSLLIIRKNPFNDMSTETFNSLFYNKFINVEKNMLNNIHSFLKNKTIDELYFDNPYDDDSKNIIKNIIKSKIKPNSLITEHEINKIISILNEYVSKLYVGLDIIINSIEILKADEKDAIEIFNRLNTIGEPLNKMEKLAAFWSSEIINIKDENILKLIENIYYIDNSKNIRDIKENTPAEIVWVLLQNSFENTSFFKSLFTEEINGRVSLKNSHMDKLIWLIRVIVLKEKNLELKGNINDSFEEDIKLGKELSNIINNDESWLLKTSQLLNKAWKKIEESCPILMKTYNEKYIFTSVPSNLFISIASQIYYELASDENYNVPKTLQLSLIKEILNGSYESSTNRVVRESIEDKLYLKEIELEDVRKKLNEINNMQKEERRLKSGFGLITKIVIALSYSKYSDNKIDRFDFDFIIPKEFLSQKNLEIGQNSIGNCGLLDLEKNRNKKDIYSVNNSLSDELCLMSDFDTIKYSKLLNLFRHSESMEDLEKIYEYRYNFIVKKFLKNINPISN